MSSFIPGSTRIVHRTGSSPVTIPPRQWAFLQSGPDEVEEGVMRASSHAAAPIGAAVVALLDIDAAAFDLVADVSNLTPKTISHA